METIVQNIGQLWMVNSGVRALGGVEMSGLKPLENAWFRIKGEKIVEVGQGNFSENTNSNVLTVDCEGGLVIPGFCDSHTHLVFADWRPEEFLQKIRGMSYSEIAEQGGGILNSAKRVEQTSQAVLLEKAKSRLLECVGYGTAAIEIKSGYGLSVESELNTLS